jgi:hypothetical protein
LSAGEDNCPYKDKVATTPKKGIITNAAIRIGKNEKNLKYHFSILFKTFLALIKIKNIPIINVVIMIIRVVQSPRSPIPKFVKSKKTEIHITIPT